MTRAVGVGLIGTGFMGACHALAFRAAPAVFGTALQARLEMVADIDRGAAEAAAARFGFARATGDWRALVGDPSVELVAITAPNALHKEMALAAIAAGKHVYCEKPLALSAADAASMAGAAEAAGVKTLAGYNYVRGPAVAFARRLIDEGVLGELTYFRGVSDEDYMADPATPFSWRCRRDMAGTGALGDLGSHLISLAHYLVGPIAALSADVRTLIAERPLAAAGDAAEKRSGAVALDASGAHRAVENEDQAHAILRFGGRDGAGAGPGSKGIMGSLATSRVAWGRKNHLAFELFGTKGTLLFDQERMNELQLFLKDEAGPGRNGFRTILSGPDQPYYGAFSPAPGHGLGFNDLKVIEVAQLLDGLAGAGPLYPDFRAAAQVEAVLDAVVRSAAERRWVDVDHHRQH